MCVCILGCVLNSEGSSLLAGPSLAYTGNCLCCGEGSGTEGQPPSTTWALLSDVPGGLLSVGAGTGELGAAMLTCNA